MITIKGMYENGEIKMLEAVPVLSSQKVLITFIENEDDDLRIISLKQKTGEFDTYIKDENEDMYQDYLKK